MMKNGNYSSLLNLMTISTFHYWTLWWQVLFTTELNDSW